MSDQQQHETPFQTLGKHLRYLREQSKESIAEVSGAVEIDEPALARIEAGFERPAEDILLLLITHYAMPNQEAIQLWELAGYDGDMPDQLNPVDELQPMTKNVIMVLALDMRTIYTDSLEIHTSATGLTLNFNQAASGQHRPVPVARLGMSYEQAGRVLEQLQQALVQAKYTPRIKALPPSTQQHPNTKSDQH